MHDDASRTIQLNQRQLSMKPIVVGIIVILVMAQLASTSTILMLRSENSALRNKLQKYESSETDFDRFYKAYQTRHPSPRE